MALSRQARDRADLAAETLVERATVQEGPVEAIADALAREAGRDIWVLGGAVTIGKFLDAGRIDKIELFIVPVLLGRGIPLFNGARQRDAFTLTEAEAFPNGLARLSYRTKGEDAAD